MVDPREILGEATRLADDIFARAQGIADELAGPSRELAEASQRLATEAAGHARDPGR